MLKLETPPGALGCLVEDLRKLGDEELLQRWRHNCAALRQPWRPSLPLSARPTLPHYAIRFVAIERWGVPGHVTQLRDAA